MIEPFNLNQEREEGYFDADGNFVEYVKENEIKVLYVGCLQVFASRMGNKMVRLTFFSSVGLRMHGWIVLMWIQGLLEKIMSKQVKKKMYRTFLLMTLEKSRDELPTSFIQERR